MPLRFQLHGADDRVLQRLQLSRVSPDHGAQINRVLVAQAE